MLVEVHSWEVINRGGGGVVEPGFGDGQQIVFMSCTVSLKLVEMSGEAVYIYVANT